MAVSPFVQPAVNLGAIYQEAKSWQTAIGSVLGFTALIVGALFNAHLTRQRDRRVRGEEAISVALALHGEIVSIRKQIADLARGVAAQHVRSAFSSDPYNRHFFENYRMPETILYAALAPKIGLLKPSLMSGIITFYANYAEVLANIPKLISDPERRYSYGPEWLLEPALAAVNDVTPTLRLIEKLIPMDAPSEIPDLGKAPRVLGMLQEENREAAEAYA